MDRVPDEDVQPGVGLHRPQVLAVVEAAHVGPGVGVDGVPQHKAGGVALLPRAVSERHPEHRDISDISQDSGA